MDYECLVKNYQNGDGKALQILIEEFHPAMTRTIYYYTNDRTPVDDIAQECWYVIIEKLPELELQISFEVWALTIAKRKAIDWIRSQQRSRKKDKALKNQVNFESEETEKSTKDEKLKKIRMGIEQMSSPHKVVLRMFYIENLSLSEISNVLGISKGTVKSRLFYAREKLKNKINQ